MSGLETTGLLLALLLGLAVALGEHFPSACSLGKGDGTAHSCHAPKDVCAGEKCCRRGSKILPTQGATRFILVDANVVSAKKRRQR